MSAKTWNYHCPWGFIRRAHCYLAAGVNLGVDATDQRCGGSASSRSHGHLRVLEDADRFPNEDQQRSPQCRHHPAHNGGRPWTVPLRRPARTPGPSRARHDDLPGAVGVMQTHGMAPAVPAVEVTHNAHAPCARRPDREGDAAHPV